MLSVSHPRDLWPTAAAAAAAHLVLVVVVPLLQEGALLGVHLGADRGPAALRLLRDVDLGRERTAEALHINPGARISRHRRETLEEGRVDGGGDTCVEAVLRVRVGYVVHGVGVDGVDGVGRGRGRGAGLHGPRGAEAGQGGRGRAYAGALYLLGGQVGEGGAETPGQHAAGAAAAAAIAVYVVRDGGVHLDLEWIYGSGRWRRSISLRRFRWRAAGVGGAALRLWQVTEASQGWGRLRGATLSVLTRLLMCFLAVLKVTQRLRRAKAVAAEIGEIYLLAGSAVIRRERARSAVGLVALVRSLSGFAAAAVALAAAHVLFLARPDQLRVFYPHRLILHVLLMRSS